MVLQLQCHLESLLKHKLLGFTPRFHSSGQGRAWEFAFLTTSQAGHADSAGQGPHFENHYESTRKMSVRVIMGNHEECPDWTVRRNNSVQNKQENNKTYTNNRTCNAWVARSKVIWSLKSERAGINQTDIFDQPLSSNLKEETKSTIPLISTWPCSLGFLSSQMRNPVP